MGRMTRLSVYHTKLQKSHNHACCQSHPERPGEIAMQLGLAIIPDGSKQQMAVQQGRL
jgi:hypothetical protein